MIPQKVQIAENVMYENTGMLAFGDGKGVSIVFKRIVKGEYGYTYTLHPLTDSDFEIPPSVVDDLILSINHCISVLERYANPKI